MMLTVFLTCFAGQIAISKLEYIFDPPEARFSLALIILMVIICILPLHVFYSSARKELARVIFHIFVSPFGMVKFKHFFFADILTSFIQPLKDIGLIICFFTSGTWLNLNKGA